MAEVFEKVAPDRVIIPAVREQALYPFRALDWLDLRVGFYLSITDDTGDDTITGLAETIAQPGGTFGLLPQARYWIGLKTRNSSMPRTPGTVFMGFTNSMQGPMQAGMEFLGDSVLSSSDAGIGTTNANFWRPNNSQNSSWSAAVTDGEEHRILTPPTNLQQHFPQNVAGAGGYSVLLGMRLSRAAVGSRVIAVRIKSTTLSADMSYSSVPANALLNTNLLTWPTTVQILQPGELSQVPDAFFFYWPWVGSRLRIHAVGLRQVI